MKKIEEKHIFNTIHAGWLQFADLVGRFNTKIIVGVIYFALVSVAWVTTTGIMKKKLLDRAFRTTKSSDWVVRTHDENLISVEKLRHQF